MAERNSDSDSSEEGEIFANVDGFGLEPYRFEPEFNEGEHEHSEESSASDDSEEEDENQDDLAWRVGHTDWCECGHCGQMPTGRESRCCQELDNILADKMTEIEGKLAYCYFV